MSLANARRGDAQRVYVSQAKETSYNNGGTLAIAFNPRKSGSYPKRNVLTTNDGQTATGYENPTQQFHLGHGMEPYTLPLLAAVESIGWALGFGLGNDTVSGTTNITHTYDLVSLSTGFPGSFILESHRAGANAVTGDKLFYGCYINEWTLSGGRTGHAELDIAISGSGLMGSPGNQTESGLLRPNRESGILPAECFTVGLKNMDAEHGPAAQTYTTPSAAFTAANITTGASWDVFTDELETWSITFRNVYADQTMRAAGQGSSSGLVGSCPVLVRREVTASLTFIDAPTFVAFLTILDAATDSNNIEKSLGIEFVNDFDLNTDDYAGGLIHVPVMQVDQNADGTFGDLNTLTVNLSSKSSMGADAYGVIRGFTHEANTAVYNQ